MQGVQCILRAWVHGEVEEGAYQGVWVGVGEPVSNHFDIDVGITDLDIRLMFGGLSSCFGSDYIYDPVYIRYSSKWA